MTRDSEVERSARNCDSSARCVLLYRKLGDQVRWPRKPLPRRAVFTHHAALGWFNVVLSEPSIKILYDLRKGAQLIAAENATWAPEASYGGGFAAARLRALELITILNRCDRCPGFVYQHAHFSADKKSIELAVRPRKGSTIVCSRCHLPGVRLRPTRRTGALSSFPFGVSRLPSVHNAAGRLSPLRRCGCRRSSLGRRQTHTLTKAYMLFLAR